MPATLVEIRNLSVSYPAAAGPAAAVRDVGLDIRRGEVLGLVGETGCGKTTLALTLGGLLAPAAGKEGSVRFDGLELLGLSERQWRGIRGFRIGFVHQDPRSALNPVLSVGSHLIETLRAHSDLTRAQAARKAVRLLASGGVPDPAFYLQRHVFELSGGLCQRVGIALALCHEPEFLIADEPSSSLDPTLQAQILRLLRDLNASRGMAMLLISHDFGVVASCAHSVAVMYHGRIVEYGSSDEVLRSPAHPYTQSLLECIPDLHHDSETRTVAAIPGAAPAAGARLQGCAFAPRCRLADGGCTAAIPGAVALSPTHEAACARISCSPS